jgi:hypothetical protein
MKNRIGVFSARKLQQTVKIRSLAQRQQLPGSKARRKQERNYCGGGGLEGAEGGFWPLAGC